MVMVMVMAIAIASAVSCVDVRGVVDKLRGRFSKLG